MGFWTDMIKYNVKNKCFSASDFSDSEFHENLDVSTSPTIEYADFAKFIPKLSGTIHIRIYREAVSDGNSRTHYFAVKEGGEIIFETNEEGFASQVDLGVFSIKAFATYTVQHKSNALNGAVYVPNKIVFSYNIVDTTKNLITQAL